MSRRIPKLVIFGDSHKPSVPQAITEFRRFVRDKARILACGSVAESASKLNDYFRRLEDRGLYLASLEPVCSKCINAYETLWLNTTLW